MYSKITNGFELESQCNFYFITEFRFVARDIEMVFAKKVKNREKLCDKNETDALN